MLKTVSAFKRSGAPPCTVEINYIGRTDCCL
jgi:hypothetical protein